MLTKTSGRTTLIKKHDKRLRVNYSQPKSYDTIAGTDTRCKLSVYYISLALDQPIREHSRFYHVLLVSLIHDNPGRKQRHHCQLLPLLR
jgi:hypothetical protein